MSLFFLLDIFECIYEMKSFTAISLSTLGSLDKKKCAIESVNKLCAFETISQKLHYFAKFIAPNMLQVFPDFIPVDNSLS